MSNVVSAKVPAKIGNDTGAFRAAHDKSFIIPNRIREGLKKLGNKTWLYEADFIKLCGGISTTDFSRFREGFTEYFFEARTIGGSPKKVWCGSKEYAAELQGTQT